LIFFFLLGLFCLGFAYNAFTYRSLGMDHYVPPEALKISNVEFISSSSAILTVQNLVSTPSYVQSISINGINATFTNDQSDATIIPYLSSTAFSVTYNNSSSTFTVGQTYTFNLTSIRGDYWAYSATYNGTSQV
jgi:hypothetical protein